MKYLCDVCEKGFNEPIFKTLDKGKLKGEKIAFSPCCMSQEFEEADELEENFIEDLQEENVEELEEIYLSSGAIESDIWD